MGADSDDEMDWRAMRARLIAQETSSAAKNVTQETSSATDGAAGYVYESPLIEQGTILLGGTKMQFGFALRQQFFHKCVLLLLQHDEQFTKGIILNRPSAITMDGWRLWCGHGQVAEGGLFVGKDAAMGKLEINCLHSLDGFMADQVSTKVIKGVSYTSLEGAKALVAAGQAQQSDFWVCVGYSGWAPGQLQMEVEKRDSWYLASADGGTLLKGLLKQAQELPPPSTESVAAAPLLGMDTWADLMRGIGREADAIPSEPNLPDRMLEEWVRAHLLPGLPPATPSPPSMGVAAGTVLCTTVAPATGRPADRCLLRDQYLHKAVLLVLSESGGEGADGTQMVSACILNRPTANEMVLNVAGNPRRRVAFCGNLELGSRVWLHYRSELGGVAAGGSGVYVLSDDEGAAMLLSGAVEASDLILVGGVVQFRPAELSAMLAAEHVRVVPPGAALSSLWPRVWALTDDKPGRVSDGTEVWWLASQCGAEQLSAPPPSELADEALEEWLKFFARANRD